MLLASQASLQQALAAQGDHVAALLQQQGQSREREAALEVELHKLKKEVRIFVCARMCARLCVHGYTLLCITPAFACGARWCVASSLACRFPACMTMHCLRYMHLCVFAHARVCVNASVCVIGAGQKLEGYGLTVK